MAKAQEVYRERFARVVSITLFAVSWVLLMWCPPSDAQAINMGLTVIAQDDGGATSVFYPTLDDETPVSRGPFRLSWATQGEPHRGNGRLVVISHGSGGSPWVHADLARSLVAHGFVVAMPQHAGDNYLDSAAPGPESWKRRPREVSQAIDLVAAHPRLSALLRLDSVGVFGGSAGGHTALSLAGGEWSPGPFLSRESSAIGL